jgi:DNA polymerase I-like protein with 3'-5' exonuclease and polymerase domains
MMACIIYDVEKPTKKQRKHAKDTFLGLTYGEGGAKLAHDYGLPTEWKHNKAGKLIEIAGPEAQAIIDKFNEKVPFVRQLAKLASQTAARRGYVKTILGRRCRFPRKKDDSGYEWTHKALNRIIQGTSADQTKTAMIDADAVGHPLQLQVHDELCETIFSRKQAEELAEIMKTCIPSTVPFKVDIEIGPSWGEAH